MQFRRHTRTVRALWAPSLARRIVRHRLVQATVFGLFAIGAALAVQARLVALDAERATWGETIAVLVVSEPVGVGSPVTSGAVVTRDLPAAMVPVGAMDHLAPGALARAELYPGEVLLESRVTGGDQGVLAPGTVAITLAVHGEAPLVDDGDLVDVWTVDSANLSSLRVARRVVVLARSDDDISIAVPAADIGDVAVAALRPVVVTLLG